MLMLEKKEKLAVNFPVNFVSEQCPHMGMALVWVLAAPFQAIKRFLIYWLLRISVGN